MMCRSRRSANDPNLVSISGRRCSWRWLADWILDGIGLWEVRLTGPPLVYKGATRPTRATCAHVWQSGVPRLRCCPGRTPRVGLAPVLATPRDLRGVPPDPVARSEAHSPMKAICTCAPVCTDEDTNDDEIAHASANAHEHKDIIQLRGHPYTDTEMETDTRTQRH